MRSTFGSCYRFAVERVAVFIQVIFAREWLPWSIRQAREDAVMAASDGDPTYEVPKEEFAALLNEAVTMATAAQLQVEQLRGVALYDPQRDERFISLKSFESAVAAALSLSNFKEGFRVGNIGLRQLRSVADIAQILFAIANIFFSARQRGSFHSGSRDMSILGHHLNFQLDSLAS
jgi:hypothetical protein